ncbi:MAG: carboxypeptidase-like regulatory domain-containing protein [Elusimicrobiota bacterium]
MVLGIGIIASFGAFGGIQKAIQYSKARTLSSNLAHEKMQIVMQKPYYEILVTTNPAYDTRFTPYLPYDPGYFPPETLLEGSIRFTRLTYIQVVQENSGVIQVLPPGSGDTGMRQVTVSVVWQNGSDYRFHSLQNVINNPNTIMSNAVIKGRVSDTLTTAGVPSALVDAAENVGWRDTSNASGDYTINLAPGTFNFVATAQGYYPKTVMVSIAPNTTVTQDFSLTPISTGTIQGNAWVNNHLVISQVVASTGTSGGLEFIELYNPTTSAWNIASNVAANEPAVWPVVKNVDDVIARHLVFVSSYVKSNAYYLIANTNDGSNNCTTLTAGGTVVQPDACWRYVNYPNHAIQKPLGSGGGGGISTPDAGGICLANSNSTPPSSAGKIDCIAWNGGSGFADFNYAEGTAISPTGATGLIAGEQFIRRTDTGTVINLAHGNAYDSGNNLVDLFDQTTFSDPPRATASGTARTPIAGTPVAGAIVSVNDNTSSPSSTTLTGNPPYASFTVPGVATGTWSVFIDSGTSSATIDNVVVTSNAITRIPNTVTTPTWPDNGVYSSFLSNNNLVGTISGRVTNVTGGIISPAIVVTIGGASATVGASGNFSIRLPTGTYNVVANASCANSSYESQTQTNVNVTLGDVTANINFFLAQGGKISGWITRDGTNPLPAVSVVALDSNGQAQATEVSGSNGQFLLLNLTTGTYTVQPVLDTKEMSSPVSNSVTVAAGTTVSAGTFTIVGAMGSITGSVTALGKPIQSGTLIVASTSAITVPPATLNAATLMGAAYYGGSSNEDGTYSLDVRGSTTSVYTVTAFYMRLNGQIPAISSGTRTNITVNAGLTTSGVNFSW